MGLFSSIGGLLGGSNKSSSSSVSGYNSLPQGQKDFMANKIFPQIEGYFNKPYENVGYENFIAQLDPAQLAGIQRLAGGGQMGGGGMVDALSAVRGTSATGTSPFVKQFLGQAGQSMTRAGELTNLGAREIGFDEVQGAANPYSQSLKDRLREQAQRTIAQTNAQLGTRGGRSFGDISAGQQLGDIQRELLSKSSDIDWQTFEDAKKLVAENRARQMTGGGQFGQFGATYGNLATQAQQTADAQLRNQLARAGAMFEMGQGIDTKQRESARDQIYAGGLLSGRTQALNEARLKDILAGRAYPQEQIANALSWMEPYKSNVNTTSEKSSPGLGKIIGGLQGAGQVVSGIASLFE